MRSAARSRAEYEANMHSRSRAGEREGLKFAALTEKQTHFQNISKRERGKEMKGNESF
jgi:hypothetical protein